MHPNAELITRFYKGFQAHDPQAMIECYAPTIHFYDPVFQDLYGTRARGMWQMLVGRTTDLTLTFSGAQADDQSGSAHWEADYTFSATGRKVHNVVEAVFRFDDGLILDHRDTFDLWSWLSQSQGLKGRLTGWLPQVQQITRQAAQTSLNTFMAKGAAK